MGRVQLKCDGARRRTGGEVKGKLANGVGSQFPSLPRNLLYPALLPLMRTPRLPVVDWTNAPCRFKWTRPFRRKKKSGFCACAITFQTQSTIYEDRYTFLIVYRSVLLLMRKVSDKSCAENQNIHCMFTNFFFFRKSYFFFFYEVMWKNNIEPDRPQMSARRLRMACWITKATSTHSIYVILIASSLQQWLHERTL